MNETTVWAYGGMNLEKAKPWLNCQWQFMVVLNRMMMIFPAFVHLSFMSVCSGCSSGLGWNRDGTYGREYFREVSWIPRRIIVRWRNKLGQAHTVRVNNILHCKIRTAPLRAQGRLAKRSELLNISIETWLGIASTRLCSMGGETKPINNTKFVYSTAVTLRLSGLSGSL